MHTPSTTTAKQYYETNALIIALFDQLEQVVDSIDRESGKCQNLRNIKDLFPIAEKIVDTVNNAADLIHEAYVNHIQHADAEAQSISVIETESWKIFQAIKTVILEARQLDVDPITNSLSRSEEPYYDDLQMRRGQTAEDRRIAERSAGYYAKKGTVQTAIIKEARRLGPEYGADFLLTVDDTFLALLTMLKSIKAAGIAIDLDQLPNAETQVEHWLEPISLESREADIETSVRHLAIIMQMCRSDATKAWATKRIH